MQGKRTSETFMKHRRADRSSPRLRKARDMLYLQHPHTTPSAALSTSVSLPVCLSGACSGPASSQISLSL